MLDVALFILLLIWFAFDIWDRGLFVRIKSFFFRGN